MANRKGRLAHVLTGKLDEPPRLVIYSDEGLGKSTLAAMAPSPIMLDIEGGSGDIDVARYPFRVGPNGVLPGGHQPGSYQDVLDALDVLLNEEHDYRAVILDTVDHLEPMLWDHLCQTRSSGRGQQKMRSIEDFGYGKGYAFALDEWRALLTKLDVVRKRRGMMVIMLGHAVVRTYKNPRGDDYDRFRLRLHDKAAGTIKEWCDVLGFLAMEETTAKEAGSTRAKGYTTGVRLLHLERDAAFEAKSRIPLPGELVVDIADPWGPLGRALYEGRRITAKQLEHLIGAELERIGDENLTEKVAEALVHADNDTARLSRYLNRLRAKPAMIEQTEEAA